ncbi:MAG: hypothetical protein U0325_27720 [Polyangiales bacterium]
MLADRFGARAVLDGALVAMCTALTALALYPAPATASALLFVAGLASGVGSAAALLLVPRRFRVTGAAGGVVGALGAAMGFALPILGAMLRREMRLATAALVPMVALAYASLLLDHLAARRRGGAPVPRRRRDLTTRYAAGRVTVKSRPPSGAGLATSPACSAMTFAATPTASPSPARARRRAEGGRRAQR